jgi:hypothetical protein
MYCPIIIQKIRLKVREWMQKEVIPNVTPYVEAAKFPRELVHKLK